MVEVIAAQFVRRLIMMSDFIARNFRNSGRQQRSLQVGSQLQFLLLQLSFEVLFVKQIVLNRLSRNHRRTSK